MRRTLRGLVLATAITGALVALPATAAAAPALSLSLTSTSAPLTSGENETFVLEITNAGDAVGGVDGGLLLEESQTGTGEFTISGTPTITACAAGADQSANVTATAGSANVTVLATFDAGCARVTYTATMPSYFRRDWKMLVRANGGFGATPPDTVNDVERIVSKGGPSILSIDHTISTVPAGLGGRAWVAKGSTPTATVTVTNNGSGAAHNVQIYNSLYTSVNELLESPPYPSFGSALTFAPTPCVPTPPGSYACTIDTIPAGGSVTYTVELPVASAFGWLELNPYVQRKADGSDDPSNHDGSPLTRVTDGSTHLVTLSMGDRDTAQGNTPLEFTGTVANAGPDAVTGGVLEIRSNVYRLDGSRYWGGSQAPGIVESIRSITLSNGATCALANTGSGPIPGQYWCPIASLPAGARLTAKIATNFATNRPDENVSVNMRLETRGYQIPGSKAYAGDPLILNPSRYVDLEMAVSAESVIGATHVAAQKVTITNRGTKTARQAAFVGTLRGVPGQFVEDALPSGCTLGGRPTVVRCGVGDLAAGQSRTFSLDVRAGSKLGALSATFDAYGRLQEEYDALRRSAARQARIGFYAGYDINPDNDAVTQSVRVVKDADAPLDATIPLSRSLTRAALLRRGLVSRVDCPTTCTVRVQLWLPRARAIAIGIRVGKGQGPVLVGTSFKKSDAEGDTVLVTSISRRFRAAFRNADRGIVLQRRTIATSTNPRNAGATTIAVQNVTIRR